MYGLKGRVKSFLEQNYDAVQKFGKWEAGKYAHSRYKIDFDKTGNCTERAFLNKDDEVETKIIPKRENGKIIEEIWYDENGKQTKIEKVSIISKDKVHEEIKNDERIVTVKYDDSTTAIMKFNKNGHIIEDIYQRGKEVSTRRYEYLELDKKKNWTKRIEFYNNKPNKIETHEIEYY
jgi:hypothetical protein